MPMKSAFSANMCNRCMIPREYFVSQRYFCIAKMVKKKIRGKLSGHFLDFMKFSFGVHDIPFGLYSSLFGFCRPAVGQAVSCGRSRRCRGGMTKRMAMPTEILLSASSLLSAFSIMEVRNKHQSKCSKFPILRFSIFRTLFSVFFTIGEFWKLFFTFSFSFLKMPYMSTPVSCMQPINRHFPSLHLRCRMKLLNSNGYHSFIWTVAFFKQLVGISGQGFVRVLL